MVRAADSCRRIGGPCAEHAAMSFGGRNDTTRIWLVTRFTVVVIAQGRAGYLPQGNVDGVGRII
jgi:hypothetical protein